jgi:hypothetical protein
MQPTISEMVIHRTTAKSFGIDVPITLPAWGGD